MSSQFDVNSLFRVDGLVAVITGGGTGIGLSIAKGLDANGAKAVYIIGRREDKLRAAAASSVNGAIIPIVGDVTSEESLRSVADRVRDEQGYINALLVNAGFDGFQDPRFLLGNTLPPKDFVEVFWSKGMSDINRSLQVNTTSVLFTTLAFLELLVAGNERHNVQQKSQVIVTTSIAAFMKAHPGPGYLASKAAATQLCKWLGINLMPYGVRVNSIAPGLFLSEMSQQYADVLAGPGGDPCVEGAVPKDIVPAGRFGNEIEMLGSVLFLLGRAGGYVSGNVLINDGGTLGRMSASI